MSTQIVLYSILWVAIVMIAVYLWRMHTKIYREYQNVKGAESIASTSKRYSGILLGAAISIFFIGAYLIYIACRNGK